LNAPYFIFKIYVVNTIFSQTNGKYNQVFDQTPARMALNYESIKMGDLLRKGRGATI